MPVLGAEAVISRIEQVMIEGFGAALMRLEAELRTNGDIGSADPDADVPTSAQYVRLEDGAYDQPVLVVTKCNSSEITNEPSNYQDLHWEHEMMVEVTNVMRAEESSADLHSFAHRYGTALVSLFGASRPCLEMGGDVTDSGFVLASAAAGGSSWSNPSNITASDNTRAISNRDGVDALEAHFTLANHVPDKDAVIVGVEVKTEGFVDDSTTANRIVSVTLHNATRQYGTAISSTLANSPSTDGQTTSGGLNQFFGNTGGISASALWGTNACRIHITPQTSGAGVGDMKIDAVSLKVYYKVLVPWSGTVVNKIVSVRYRDEVDDAGAFSLRSASVVMEVVRRELND